MVVDSTFSSIYVAGSISTNIGLFKFLTSGGTCSFAYSITNTNGVSTDIKMTTVSLSENLLTNSIFGCAENLGADSFDIALLLYTETFLTLVTAITESWYFDNSVQYTCIQTRVDSTYGQFLLHQ